VNKKKLILSLACLLAAALPALAEANKFTITEYSVQGNTLLAAPDIAQRLIPFTGAEREVSDVTQAVEALKSMYHTAGFAAVQVAAPEQTLTSGKVLIKVLEDKISAIEVTGNEAFDADNIRASLPLLMFSASLNAKALEAAIALANENAAKQVSVNIQPGAKAGDIITTINVVEDRISKFTATYDNTGSDATGLNKISLSYQNANLFNSDHSLNLQLSGSLENLDKVYSVSLGYHKPFYEYGVSADLIAAYSSSSGQNGNLYFAGKGTVLGARLNYPLPSLGDIRQKLIVGLDIKDSESISGLLITPITEIPVSLSYTAQLARSEFQGSASATYLTNITSGPHGFADDYANARPGTAPSTKWQALRFNSTGGFALPNDWQARVGINAQFSGDLLLPSEQFGAGGASSVRGYPERVISGDEGYSANFELYTPELNKLLGWDDASIRALLFWDLGATFKNDNPLPASISGVDAIEGVGLGLRLTYKKSTTFKLDVGWAQKKAVSGPVTVNIGDSYGNVAMSVAF
jgi:hemolysin activation/secretion protein